MNTYETFETTPSREKDPSRESRETKEKEIDPELAAAAMMERADLLVKEVKTNKKQIANIFMHIAQVQQLIKKIRTQLQLQTDDHASSLTRDEEQIQKLKKQIAEYKEELIKMQDDLVNAYTQELAKTQPEISQIARQQQAEQMVHNILSV